MKVHLETGAGVIFQQTVISLFISLTFKLQITHVKVNNFLYNKVCAPNHLHCNLFVLYQDVYCTVGGNEKIYFIEL